MTQQSDWIKEREAIRARRAKATEGPYFVSMDRAHDAPDHADSGLAKIDTGRESDWWIARLCEWPTAKFLAASWDDIGALLDHADEDEREIERLRGHIANYTVRVNEPQNEAGETAVEPEDIIYALRAELASRKQRISELERRLRIPFGKFPCAQCGGPHDFDTSIPSVIWNDVIRAKSLPEYLCTTCIVREFVRAGRSFTAQLWNEEFNGASVEFIVNGQNAQDAAAIQDENNRLRNELAVLRKANEEILEQAIQRLKGSWSTDMGNDWNGAINKAIGIVEAARSRQSD